MSVVAKKDEGRTVKDENSHSSFSIHPSGPKNIVLKPRLSEKTFALSGTTVYVFDVPTTVNKQTVASAVAAQFEVTVMSVRITNLKGKAKRTVRKSGRAVSGVQSDRKKAYVTLKEGDKLPFFDVPEDDKKKSDKNTEKAAPVKSEKTVKAENKTARRGFLRMRKTGEK